MFKKTAQLVRDGFPNLTYYSYDDEDIDTDLTPFLALEVDWNAFYIKIVHCSHLVLWHIVMNIT